MGYSEHKFAKIYPSKEAKIVSITCFKIEINLST